MPRVLELPVGRSAEDGVAYQPETVKLHHGEEDEPTTFVIRPCSLRTRFTSSGVSLLAPRTC